MHGTGFASAQDVSTAQLVWALKPAGPKNFRERADRVFVEVCNSLSLVLDHETDGEIRIVGGRDSARCLDLALF